MLLRTDILNALATDLNLDILEETETREGDPLNGVGGECREVYLEVDAVDQITVTGDLGDNRTTESSSTIEGVGNGLL